MVTIDAAARALARAQRALEDTLGHNQRFVTKRQVQAEDRRDEALEHLVAAVDAVEAASPHRAADAIARAICDHLLRARKDCSAVPSVGTIGDLLRDYERAVVREVAP